MAVSRKSKERKKVHKLTLQSNLKKKIPGVHIIKKEQDYTRQRQFKVKCMCFVASWEHIYAQGKMLLQGN